MLFTNRELSGRRRPSGLHGLGVWLRRQRARLRNRGLGQGLKAEFSGLTPCEYERRLTDIGLTPDDLVALGAGRPIPPQLMSRMIRRLGLKGALSRARPETTTRLITRCRACGALGECEAWLDDETAKHTPPRFCPNRDLFLDLARRDAGGPPTQASAPGKADSNSCSKASFRTPA
jgi:hypothetical protein